MTGTIGREPLPVEPPESVRELVPPGGEFGICRRQWRGYTVEGLEITMPSDEGQVISRQLQIPLRHRAIQIAVIGQDTVDQEISVTLNGLIESLEGESNWDDGVATNNAPTATAPEISIGERVKGFIWLVIGIAVIALVVKASRSKDSTEEEHEFTSFTIHRDDD